MSERREKVLQTAEKLVARGKLSQAIREYRKLLRESPNDANTLNRIGDLYARQDNLDEAVALFQKIAESYSRDGFFVKSIAIYKKIIRLDPTQLDVYERLAELYHRQGLVSEARSQYQVLADYYSKHGDRPATIEVHRKMADLEPSDLSPRVKLAELYLAEGLIEETIGEYQRIAEVMLDHGRLEEATKVYLRALDVDSGDLAFISEAVLRLRDDGHEKAATRVFEAAVELNPEAAELAERMREHGGDESEPPSADELEGAADEPLAADPDSVDVADLIDVDAPEDASAAAASDAAIPAEARPAGMTEDGAFVIELDERSEAEAPRQEEAAHEEVEIDLAELEAAATESPDAESVAPEAAEPEAETQAGAPPAESRGREGKGRTAEPGDPLTSIDELAASVGIGDRKGSAPQAPGDVEAAEDEAAEAASAATTESTGTAADAGAGIVELLAEAEVFGRYGLRSRAQRRLERAVELEPGNFEAHRRLVMLHLQRGVEDDVIESAQRLLDDVEAGTGDGWDEVLGALSAAGYLIEDDRVRRADVAPAGAGGSEEVDSGDGGAGPDSVEAEASEVADEEGLEWLEAAAGGEEGSDAALFDVEEEFLDLAAELEQQFASGESSHGEARAASAESLEDIVQGFKESVAEVLSPEAYATHYNLGIAYREMGLVDEAIGEFQLAAKDPAHLVDSCSMLGACFLDKGFPDLAIKWYRKGLDSPDIDEEGSLSLLYDLGSVQAAAGDREAAYEVFVEIYGINSHYRDVVARLEELRG